MRTKTIVTLLFLLAVLFLTGCAKNHYQGYLQQQQYPRGGDNLPNPQPQKIQQQAQPSYAGGCGLAAPADEGVIDFNPTGTEL